ncbi:MAG: ATP-dependent DNA helicase PcrA, partial [Calditrichaeota bacterium]|nr:ATP-dependent DNA helicase PcrA [Calditrichota bacterium]
FERSLRAAGVPYQVIGGLRFYERKEVKDMLAYLRLLVNPADDISFLRVVNYPPRGIGNAIVAQMQTRSAGERIPLFQAGIDLLKEEGLTLRQKGALIEFYKIMDEFRAKIGKETLMNVSSELLERIKLKERLAEEEKEDKSRAESKVGNVENLVNEISRYDEERPEGGLEGFLEEVALVTDVDRFDETQERVSLLTIHSAKGLEFPVVLIGGLEDGLLPLLQANGSASDVEEERRLFYVAVTRAMHQVVLGFARLRMRWGESRWNGEPSRFLREIPPELLALPGKYHQKAVQPVIEKHSLAVEPDDLRTGLLIKHPKFGLGMVTTFRKAGLDSSVNVDFDTVGRKTLILRYANLEIVK